MGGDHGGCSTAPRTALRVGCWAPKVTSAEAETPSQAALLKLLTRRGGSWDCVENKVVIYEQFQETRAAPLIPVGFTPPPPPPRGPWGMSPHLWLLLLGRCSWPRRGMGPGDAARYPQGPGQPHFQESPSPMGQSKHIGADQQERGRNSRLGSGLDAGGCGGRVDDALEAGPRSGMERLCHQVG